MGWRGIIRSGEAPFLRIDSKECFIEKPDITGFCRRVFSCSLKTTEAGSWRNVILEFCPLAAVLDNGRRDRTDAQRRQSRAGTRAARDPVAISDCYSMFRIVTTTGNRTHFE